MGKDISLFSGYSQKENRLTNYTLLVIKLLYEESPTLYQEFLDSLLSEQPLPALPHFEQQKQKEGTQRCHWHGILQRLNQITCTRQQSMVVTVDSMLALYMIE